jgi:hypothetical protein
MEKMIFLSRIGGGEREKRGGGRGDLDTFQDLDIFIKLSRSLYTVLSTLRWLHHAAIG